MMSLDRSGKMPGGVGDTWEVFLSIRFQFPL